MHQTTSLFPQKTQERLCSSSETRGSQSSRFKAGYLLGRDEGEEGGETPFILSGGAKEKGVAAAKMAADGERYRQVFG